MDFDKVLVDGVVIGMMLRAACAWRFGCMTCRRSTQVPVKYSWWTENPRLVPLHDREHGSWNE